MGSGLWAVFKSRFKKKKIFSWRNSLLLLFRVFLVPLVQGPLHFAVRRTAHIPKGPSCREDTSHLRSQPNLCRAQDRGRHLAGPLHCPQIPSSSYHSDQYHGKVKDTAYRMANTDPFPCRNQGKQVETLQVAARPPSLCCHTGQSGELWLLQKEKSPKPSKLREHTLPEEQGMSQQMS